MLSKRGHVPHVASNVAEAINTLERNTLVDLLILDNQLQGEFGWQFLDHVRKDFVFRSIPALIYTGSSDRNSVLKYLQLGVQKILVKPYNAQHIEEELKRAVEQDWRGMIFEPAERVCQRLNITEDDYYKALTRAAVDLRDRVPQLNKLVGSRDLRLFDDHVSTLQSLALNLGVSVLENAIESITEALRKDKLDQAIYFINRLVPTARLMHHRALAHFGLTNSDDFPQDLFDGKRVDAPKKKPDVEAQPTGGPAADPVDVMLQSPLNAYAEHFRILLTRPVLYEGEMIATVFGQDAAGGIEDLSQCLHFLRDLDARPPAELVSRIEQIPGLTERLINLANTMATGPERVRSLDQAIEVAGSSTAACVVVTHQWLRVARRERNPLRLEQMAQHNLGVSILVRELATKFKQTHEFAVAAIAHNIGKWVMAFQYPAFFGLALTLGKGDSEEHSRVERRLFGISHKELGGLFLEHHKIGDSAVATTRFLNNPVEAPAGMPQIVTSMVNLANLLAKAKRVGFSGSTNSVNKQDFINSPAWEALKQAQVKIPLDPTEYLSALGMVVERVRRQVDILFD